MGGCRVDVSRAIRERRSIRKFLKKEIPDDVVDELSDALIWAPSAGNLQSRKFLFVKDDKTKRLISLAALKQTFIAQAPLVVVGCTDDGVSLRYGERGVRLYTIQDVSASLMCMMLLAHEKGIGSVWVGAFGEEEVAEILALPGNQRPVAIVPLGYPDEAPSPPPRVSKEEAIRFL